MEQLCKTKNLNKKESAPSIIGGACIIASVCVGAGMLGLPSSGAGAWTLWTLSAIALTMIVMSISGLMLLEVYKNYDLKVSFNSVTKDLLGNKVNILNNITVYFVGGILLYAYISSSGLILQDLLGINSKIASILFVAFFSFFVWHSTRAVDRISIILITFMLLSFIFGVSGLSVNINLAVLFDSTNNNASYAPYAMAILPIALTSFGYHHSVSSMRDYYGEEKKAKYAILGGTLIAFLLYSTWIIAIFGNLPRQEFAPIIKQSGNIDVLLTHLSNKINSNNIANAINAFSMAALLSSFIGVGLGLFDFIADLFNFNDDKSGRYKTWATTFIPPLLMSLLFPFGFIMAIGYAGAAATIWTCIIPALLVTKVRKLAKDKNGFKAPGGKFMVIFVILFGLFTALFHVLTMLDKLPIFIH